MDLLQGEAAIILSTLFQFNLILRLIFSRKLELQPLGIWNSSWIWGWSHKSYVVGAHKERYLDIRGWIVSEERCWLSIAVFEK